MLSETFKAAMSWSIIGLGAGPAVRTNERLICALTRDDIDGRVAHDRHDDFELHDHKLGADAGQSEPGDDHSDRDNQCNRRLCDLRHQDTVVDNYQRRSDRSRPPTVPSTCCGDGTVINGSRNNTKAVISGGFAALEIARHGVVTNFATIMSPNGAGIGLGHGGRVSNGGATSPFARIQGGLVGIAIAWRCRHRGEWRHNPRRARCDSERWRHGGQPGPWPDRRRCRDRAVPPAPLSTPPISMPFRVQAWFLMPAARL